MFTSRSLTECMSSGGATAFGQGCLQTSWSNMCLWGAWIQLGVSREGGACQKHIDLFGVWQDMPVQKSTVWCSNWHQSHMRHVNSTKTYHKHGKQGTRLIPKSWCRSLNAGLHLMKIPDFGTSSVASHLDPRSTLIMRSRWEWAYLIKWLDNLCSSIRSRGKPK